MYTAETSSILTHTQLRSDTPPILIFPLAPLRQPLSAEMHTEPYTDNSGVILRRLTFALRRGYVSEPLAEQLL